MEFGEDDSLMVMPVKAVGVLEEDASNNTGPGPEAEHLRKKYRQIFFKTCTNQKKALHFMLTEDKIYSKFLKKKKEKRGYQLNQSNQSINQYSSRLCQTAHH